MQDNRRLSVFFIPLLLLGCRPHASTASTTSLGPPPGWQDPSKYEDSPFGLEYAFPHDYNQPLDTAEKYREIGAKWIKFQNTHWKVVEPDEPEGGKHVYDWEKLDAHLRVWQAAGYNILVHVTATSDWAMGEAGGKAADTFGVKVLSFFKGMARAPKPEYLDDYGDFIEALVERYDGDGLSDMPGLLTPVLYYEIESEVQHIIFWAGSVEDYRKLLKTAYARAKKANPSVKVLLSGIHLGDLVRDNPDEDALDARFRRLVASVGSQKKDLAERVRDFVPALFTMGDSFDIVEFHALEDYSAIPGTVEWIRKQMRKNGISKPVWVGDATSALELQEPLGLPPDQGLNVKQRAEIRKVLDQKLNLRHSTVKEWYETEQARLAFKKYIVSIGAGAEKIFMVALEDWPGPFSPWPYFGMIDKDGEKKPVYETIKLLSGKLQGFDSVRKIEMGKGVYFYEFFGEGRKILVLWYDDGKVRMPGEKESQSEIVIPFSKESATVTEIVTKRGAQPKVSTLKPTQGKILFKLGSTPVFVE